MGRLLSDKYRIEFTIDDTTVSYLEKIQERSRYAKQGVLFIELTLHLREI